MASDFIGGGIPASSIAHTDPAPVKSIEDPAPVATAQPPASSPGSDDPSGGIAKDAGGVSGSAYVGAANTEPEEKTIVGTVLETVFGKKERTAEEHDNNAAVASKTEEPASGSGAAGVLGAVAGSVAAGTAAVAGYVGLSNNTQTPEQQGQETAASVEKSAAETQAAASEKVAETTESAKETVNEATDEGKKTEEPVDSVDAEKAKKIEDHKAAVRENTDAIPTAGGEKLGQAHEGESKVIPANPPPQADETLPGQTDKTTAENTAKNVGDAPAAPVPKKRTSLLGHKRDASEGGKPKFLDRLKAKLHLDKKDKPTA